MKHTYNAACGCSRCVKERERRSTQGSADAARNPTRGRIRQRKGSRRPTWGSAEWAETRGDDIPSYDVPGDDFDA